MNPFSPSTYKEAPEWKKLWVCNGTGAAGSPKWLVAILDSFKGWGINFRAPANVHDWMYCYGLHWWEKLWADFIFLINMIIASANAIFQKPLSAFIGNLIVFPFRIARAYIYFFAVLVFGWGPFYSRVPEKPEHKLKLRVSIFK